METNDRTVLEDMPQRNDYNASRYDTDDEIVLSLWVDGVTWDIRIKKT